MRTIECFFDCSSPWTYLGFESLEQLRERVHEPAPASLVSFARYTSASVALPHAS